MTRRLPTKAEFDAALEVFGETIPALQGWDMRSIALGFALARGCESEAFAVVYRLLGEENPFDERR